MLKKYFYKKVSKTLCIVMAIALALSPSMESYAYDDGNRDDNSFVHVNNESASKGADSDILFTDLLSHGVSYLNNQSKEKYGDEWNIFTLLSADENIEKSDKKRYVNDVWKLLNEDCENVKQKKASKLKPTDYARLIIALTCLEIDPTNFYGYDLVEKLYNYKTMDSSPSNYVAWSLIAMDSHKYEIPSDAKWQREELVSMLLDFQTKEGGFGLINNQSCSLDMTAMVLQALAPYIDNQEVKASCDKAVNWMRSQMTSGYGFVVDGKENSCSSSQVITALCGLGIDPTDVNSGFTSTEQSIVQNLAQFQNEEGGFSLFPEGRANYIATYQVTYSLIAFRNLKNGENFLYDMSEISIKNPEIDYGKKQRKKQKICLNVKEKKYKKSSIKKNKSFQIKAQASGKGKITYSSSNKKYVTVSSKGKVTIKKNPKKGTYYITVQAAGNGLYTSCKTKVKIMIK